MIFRDIRTWDALRFGAPALIDVVTQLLPFIGYPRTLNGLRAIEEVIPA